MTDSHLNTQRLRLLFLSDAVVEDLPGGSRMAARELARGLTERGHQVTFLVARHQPGTPDEETRDGIRILRYAGAGKATEFVRRGKESCEKLIAEQSFDLVHTQFAYAAVGPLCAVPKSVPRVRTFHGPWDQEGWIQDTQGSRTESRISAFRARIKRHLRRKIERCSLESSAKVLTLSHCFRDMAVSQYGVGEQQIEIIPGGADTDSFQPLSSQVFDKAALRRELGLAAGRQILLSVRRLVPRMGLDKLIQAMPEIIARCPAAHLIIGGQGPEEPRLRQIIISLKLDAHVQLIGFIPPEQLISYYQAADLFVLPTMALEGFGLVTTEALSCGLPVIGTPIGATPEILTPLDHRLITLSTEPHGLAQAIVGYLNGSWRMVLTPQHLHGYILQNYTWDRHVARTEQVYRDLLNSPLDGAEYQSRK